MNTLFWLFGCILVVALVEARDAQDTVRIRIRRNAGICVPAVTPLFEPNGTGSPWSVWGASASAECKKLAKLPGVDCLGCVTTLNTYSMAKGETVQQRINKMADYLSSSVCLGKNDWWTLMLDKQIAGWGTMNDLKNCKYVGGPMTTPEAVEAPTTTTHAPTTTTKAVETTVVITTVTTITTTTADFCIDGLGSLLEGDQGSSWSKWAASIRPECKRLAKEPGVECLNCVTTLNRIAMEQSDVQDRINQMATALYTTSCIGSNGWMDLLKDFKVGGWGTLTELKACKSTQSKCEPGWVISGPSNMCFKDYRTKFPELSAMCASLNAVPALPTSEEDEIAIASVVGTGSGWIGIYRNSPDSVEITPGAELVSLTSKKPITYNMTDHSNEKGDCVQFVSVGNWMLTKCTDLLNFVCQKAGFTRDATCDAGWTLFGKKCYKRFDTNPMGHGETARFCTGQGGALAIPTSMDENRAIAAVATTNSWIGIMRKAPDSDVVTGGGVDIGFTNWAVGQPRANDACASIVIANNGKWTCIHSFIHLPPLCQKDAS